MGVIEDSLRELGKRRLEDHAAENPARSHRVVSGSTLPLVWAQVLLLVLQTLLMLSCGRCLRALSVTALAAAVLTRCILGILPSKSW